jgi:ABC transporter, phosphonate, periplasmic substrate-binding protein
MKKYLLLLSMFLCLTSFGQGNKLKLILVNHDELASNDSLIRSFQGFINEIKEKAPNFNYETISYSEIDYMKSPNRVEESTIGSMKAANFIYCNKHLSNKLIPIFIVKKNNQELPYYSSYFIVNKNSNIKTINSPEIKTLYYVDEQSASGYIVPIHMLWESGVILQPSLKSAKLKFGEKNVIKAGSHQEVITKVNEDNSFSSIGLCGEQPVISSNSTILLRYSLLPQDVIYVSQNLKQFIPQIKDWFKEHVSHGLFRNTPTSISGIEEFTLEHQAAYSYLEKVIDRVEFSETSSDKGKLTFEDINTPNQLFHFLMNLKFTEISTIIGLFLAFFSTGLTIGLKFPKMVKIFKTLNKGK